MAFIVNFIKKLFLDPIGYKNCPTGFIAGVAEDQKGLCFPSLKAHLATQVAFRTGDLIYVNENDNPENQTWKRFSKPATPYQLASSSNCPPNTIPFNGTCFSSCPLGYSQNTFLEPDGKTKSVRCLAQCHQTWHSLTWLRDDKSPEGNPVFKTNAITFVDGNGSNITKYDQLDNLDEFWCYHIDSGSAGDPTNSDGYISVPISIQPNQTLAGGTIGQGSNMIRVKQGGIYGERKRLKLGAPTMAGNCPPPNVTTDIQCLMPTPKGMELIGNEWFTSVKCPEDLSTPFDDDKQCIPKPIIRKQYGSLLDIILWFATFIVVAFIIIKLITSLRR